jgi:hypothetical protein
VLAAVAVTILAGAAGAESSAPYVEATEKGSINWASGAVVAAGRAAADAHAADAAGLEPDPLQSVALFDARQRLFALLSDVRVNAEERVGDMAAVTPLMATQLKEMAARPVPIPIATEGAGTVEVRLEFSLYGGFSQLVLPRDIKQIDSVRQVPPAPSNSAPAAGRDAFTGLVLDARTIAALPAMAPRILDENRKAVYGAAFVSREYAVQSGISAYVTELPAALKDPRVGSNPLIVKGLAAEGTGRCDIIISNADADRLRKSWTHLTFLKECRVVIVLSPPK